MTIIYLIITIIIIIILFILLFKYSNNYKGGLHTYFDKHIFNEYDIEDLFDEYSNIYYNALKSELKNQQCSHADMEKLKYIKINETIMKNKIKKHEQQIMYYRQQITNYKQKIENVEDEFKENPIYIKLQNIINSNNFDELIKYCPDESENINKHRKDIDFNEIKQRGVKYYRKKLNSLIDKKINEYNYNITNLDLEINDLKNKINKINLKIYNSSPMNSPTYIHILDKIECNDEFENLLNKALINYNEISIEYFKKRNLGRLVFKLTYLQIIHFIITLSVLWNIKDCRFIKILGEGFFKTAIEVEISLVENNKIVTKRYVLIIERFAEHYNKDEYESFITRYNINKIIVNNFKEYIPNIYLTSLDHSNKLNINNYNINKVRILWYLEEKCFVVSKDTDKLKMIEFFKGIIPQLYKYNLYYDDWKYENIMKTENGKIVLTDFDVSYNNGNNMWFLVLYLLTHDDQFVYRTTIDFKVLDDIINFINKNKYIKDLYQHYAKQGIIDKDIIKYINDRIK